MRGPLDERCGFKKLTGLIARFEFFPEFYEYYELNSICSKLVEERFAVIPAKTGPRSDSVVACHPGFWADFVYWIPAYAGMTIKTGLF
jgi:hypothetical protein